MQFCEICVWFSTVNYRQTNEPRLDYRWKFIFRRSQFTQQILYAPHCIFITIHRSFLMYDRKTKCFILINKQCVFITAKLYSWSSRRVEVVESERVLNISEWLWCWSQTKSICVSLKFRNKREFYLLTCTVLCSQDRNCSLYIILIMPLKSTMKMQADWLRISSLSWS